MKTRRHQWIAVLVLPLLVGCVPYARARLGLATQVHRGLDLAEAHAREQAAVAESLAEMQRQRLDEAFARDVSESPGLDPPWVIEGAAVYAQAAVTIEQDRAQRARSAERAAENLNATREALRRIERLDELEIELTDTGEGDER